MRFEAENALYNAAIQMMLERSRFRQVDYDNPNPDQMTYEVY